MKTYHSYQLDCREAEKKLRAAEVQRAKIQQSIPKEKLERNKKFKVIEKEVLKVRILALQLVSLVSNPLASLYLPFSAKTSTPRHG